ncbi:MAG: hypothetical protein U9N73_08945 [Candidatus Auribacterota bacterium]|nr:hypothetical protein [Candidatus Auribacterota bacterium]
MVENAKGSVLTQRLLELTWKPGKIFLQTGTLIVAYFVLLIARWIAPESVAWLASIINYIGIIIAYFIALLGMTAVAKMTLADLKGEAEIPARAALGAAMGKGKEIITSPIKIFGIFAGLVVFHGIIDLLGKIPFIGELGWMFSPVVTFPLGIAMVATILILVFGAMILPTIIMLGKEGPVSELIDFLRKNTVKFAGHFLIALVVAIITLIVLTWALNASNEVSRVVMGEKFGYIQNLIPGWVQHAPGFENYAVYAKAATWKGIMPEFNPITNPKAFRWTEYLAGFVYGIIMWLIQMSILGFIVTNFSVAGTLSYVGLTGDEEPGEEIEEEIVAEEPKKAPKPKPAPKKASPEKKEPKKEETKKEETKKEETKKEKPKNKE